MSIFISIVAYRDPELENTIRSAINNARNPESLKFGIVNQDVDSIDLSGFKNYSLISLHPKHAKGVGFARNKAMSLYTDEEYYLQIDSHMIFVEDWDVKLIQQYKLAQEIAKNKKIILSSYPPPYSIERNGERFIHTASTDELPIEPTKQVPWLRTDDQWGARRVSMEQYDFPELSTTILAGFVFATGNIVSEIPYDPEISFFGEEICFAARAWTRGWDIYSPSIPIVYHFYKRHGYKKIWSDEVRRIMNWEQLENVSKLRQENVLRGNMQNIYGLGNVRSIKEYEQLIGFDFNKIYDDLTKSKQ